NPQGDLFVPILCQLDFEAGILTTECLPPLLASWRKPVVDGGLEEEERSLSQNVKKCSLLG
ncbi:MAG: hypothetical protein F6K36_30625, partial [Symploca sp. SIO3C6]|nr:hypothetical protein [Symploca sp. SIO3C6]